MTRTVLITGTSSGLGRATAKHFHAKGWNVIATMRTPERETEFGQLDRMLLARLDVQEADSIRAAVDAGIARFGGIDVLVNNAGYGVFGPLEATPAEKIRRQFDVNVLGLLATTQAVLPHFREHRAGTIVNVSSMGGRMAFPLGSLYHGTKFAVEGLSEALQYELAPLGVHVRVVEPGVTLTDFGGRSLDFNNDLALDAYQPLVQSVLGAMGPMMANGSRPEQIAEVIYAAATDIGDRLRFEAGEDAIRILATRRVADDAAFFGGMKAQFSIGA
ncbi:short-chain dehydrogenase/reductase [Roseateles aquatilis]|uniref:Short-chain dehydrogenase/reductase n=1 Tax=Roseateles aquatilis TaxID=431061 RepID=A0A246JGR9_9BURK|nr:SDR family oxidoreductase [Roseateles aquatilis]OWQ91846.1 short-chain dehydrogenase/reductase [Roseateles aquatilis]